MKGHGGTLNAYHCMNEANPKRLHTVSFQLCDVLEKAELGGSERTLGSKGWGVRGAGGRDEKAEHRGLYGSETTQYDTVGGYKSLHICQSPHGVQHQE